MHRVVASAFASSVALSLLLVASAARAQVNTEPLRKKVKADGYFATVQASVIGRTGNTEGLQAGGAIGLGLSEDRHMGFVFANADYSRFNGATQVNKAFAHARYNYEFLPWLWGEAFAQLQSDEFQRLKLRQLFGVGPRFRVLHEDDLDLYVGTAYMIEREVIDVEEGSTDRRDEVYARSSTYFTAHWNLDTRVTFATTAYVQPRIELPSDTRLLWETLLSFKVNTLLSAGLSAVVRYDSNPASGVKTTDTEVKNTLSLTF